MLALLQLSLPILAATAQQSCITSHGAGAEHAAAGELCDARAVSGNVLLTIGSSVSRSAEGEFLTNGLRGSSSSSSSGGKAAAQSLSRSSSALARTAARLRAVTAQLGDAAGQLRPTRQRSADDPMSAEWFRAFSEAESTDDEDLAKIDRREFDQHNRREFDPLDKDILGNPAGSRSDPYGAAPHVPAEWFEETASGGQKQAWQTFYPAVARGGRLPHGRADLSYLDGDESSLHVSEDGADDAWTDDEDVKSAAWFDSSVTHYDGYGRKRLPAENSARNFIEWTPRTRNTTLKCAAAGCIANATLTAFDAGEEPRHCMLTIGLYATDFDDEFSREHLEWVTVNGQIVNTKCDPMASGCKQSGVAIADRPLYPCVSEMELTDSLLATGVLNISGKNNPMVDECPVEGNLLSGVATVTCFVRTTPEWELSVEPLVVTPPPISLNVSAPLQCKEPGCEATAHLRLGLNATNKTCRLTVSLNMTDFDDTATEEIVYLKIDGEINKEHMKPGLNPCSGVNAASEDITASAAETSAGRFVLLSNEDVSASAAEDGVVTVSAKLSDMVDECGSNGFLLDGVATVICD